MIRHAVHRPVAVTMAYLAVALLGVAAWRNIPIELLPDTELPRFTLTAAWPGASPETVEAFLTSPLEAAVQQIRGVEKVTSTSSEGEARIEVELSRDADVEFARLDLSERLAILEESLPAGAAPPRVQPYVPPEFQDQRRPFLSYTATGPYTAEALSAHLEDVVAPALRQVEGVADVVVLGGRARLLELELDEPKLLALRLTPEQVRQRVAALEIVKEAGAVRDAGTVRTLTLRQRAGAVDDVRRLILLSDRGRIVRVGDVARVHNTFEDARSHYRIDGEPAVAFHVLRESGTNAVAVADRAKAALAALAGAHPPGFRLLLDDDESDAVRRQLTDLRARALLSGAVVFAVLLLFLASLRAAVVVFATIAFSVLITLNLIHFGSLTLNVLTLMGLAMGFGLVVDNAIVVLENVVRRHSAGEDAPTAAERGSREVALAVLASTLTTFVVLVPFVHLQGELRIYYVPLALVVGFSLLASLFVAFTFIPALSARLLRGGARPPARPLSGDDPTATHLPVYARRYRGLVAFTLRWPRLTVLTAILAFGGSWYLFDRYVTRGVLWSAWWGEQSYIEVRITQPRGEELDRTDELVRHFETRLAALPEVERFVTHVRPRVAQIRITFPDSLERTAVPITIREQLVAYSHLFGGADVRVFGFGPSFYGGSSSPPTYRIEVRGYNYERVREIAEDLGRRLRSFSRIRDVDTNASGYWYLSDRATEVVLRLDRRRLALHGLSVRDAVRHVAAAVRGETQRARVRIAGEEMRFDAKLASGRDMDLVALRELLIPTAGGGAVRLADVATIDEREVMSRIEREDQQYRRGVAFEFRGPVKLGDRVRAAVMAATALPPGYSLHLREGWRWSEEEKAQIYGVLAVALLLVFMVTAALFESLRQPFCVLLTVPMALIGVFLLFFFTGASFTREAYVGVIMMGGIVVNNAILLVDHVNRLRRNAGLPLEQALARGAAERIRPILMTSLTTILGLLPLVVASESADANIWNALGYALIGGLSSSTLLVLTVTPALYLLFERGRRTRRSPFNPAASAVPLP